MEESGDELSNLLAEEKLTGIPLLVYANKQDLDLAEREDKVSKVVALNTKVVYPTLS